MMKKYDRAAGQPLAVLLLFVLPIALFVIMSMYIGVFPAALFLAGGFIYLTLRERRLALVGALACFLMAVGVYTGGL